MKRTSQAFRINKRLAEHSWGRLSSRLITSLRSLTSDYGLSVGRGDIREHLHCHFRVTALLAVPVNRRNDVVRRKTSLRSSSFAQQPADMVRLGVAAPRYVPIKKPRQETGGMPR